MRRTIQPLLLASIAFVATHGAAHAGGPLSNVIMNLAEPTTNREHSPVVAGIGSDLVAVWGRNAPTRLVYGTSVDGGASFTQVGEVPGLSGYTWRYYPQIVSNPNTGEFWLAGGMLIPSPNRLRIAVVKGTFSGPTFSWGTPVFVTTADIPISFIYIDPLVSLVADSATGNLYLAFAEIYSSNTLQVYRSFDGGATWGGPLAGVPLLYSPHLAMSAAGELVAIGGTAATIPLHVALSCAVSPNPGDPVPSWTTTAIAADIPVNNLSLPGISWWPYGSSLAADRTGGAHHGRLYAGWVQPPAFDLQPLPDPFDPEIQSIEVEPNDGGGDATPLPVGNVMHAELSSDTDVDFFKLSLAGGDRVIVAGDSAAASVFLSLNVFAPDGVQKLGNTTVFSDAPRPVLFSAPTAGDYLLRLSRLSGTTPYGYRLRIAPGAAETPGRDTRDVVVAYSDDDGATWSSPVRVNDDPAHFDNSEPTVAVGADGCPYVWWLDFRDDIYGSRSHVYLTRSGDGGDTWAASTVVTSAQSDWTATTQGSIHGHGSMAAVGPRLHLAWNDGRNGNHDAYSAAFLTDFEISDCTPGSMVAPDDEVAIGATITNHNPLFSNDYTVTLSDQRGWPLPQTVASAPDGGQVSPSLLVSVPDTAAAGVNVVTVHVSNQKGTLEHTCDVALEVTGPTAVGDRPVSFGLETVRPNPAFGQAEFAFGLPAAGRATLVLYGLRGEVVRTLVDAERPAGRSSARWDGRDSGGQQVAPGAYYVKLSAAGRTAVRRLVYLR